MVWEYINPYFFEATGRVGGATPAGINNFVFRAFRHTEEQIEAAREN